MCYTYYKVAIENTKEHYLAAGELSDFLFKCGYESTGGKLPIRNTSQILKTMERVAEMEPLFYPTRNGLMRVFPKGVGMIVELVKKLDTLRDESDWAVLKYGSTYKFKYNKEHDERKMSQ